MKKIQILKEDKTPYLTKDGLEMFENIIELGDKFIPKLNTVLVNDKGKFPNYSIPAQVITKDNEIFEEIFIKLTPTHAKVINATVGANQFLFNTYNYTNEFGLCLGISCKELKKPKTLSDFGIMGK
jgi:hypothetical protein